MSEAREAKQREWRCNIFTQALDRPMFDRKRRPDSSVSGSRIGFTIGHEGNGARKENTINSGMKGAGSREDVSPTFSHINGKGALKAAGARNLTKSMICVDELFSTAQAVKK